MAATKMIAEEEATGRVKEIYQDIKTAFGIDFVPNMYKVMSPNPRLPRGELEQGQGSDDWGWHARPAHEGDHRGRRLGAEQLRLLTASSHFCGAEAGLGRPGCP
jgi:hypothetical protein